MTPYTGDSLSVWHVSSGGYLGGGGVSYNVTYSYGCYGDLFE